MDKLLGPVTRLILVSVLGVYHFLMGWRMTTVSLPFLFSLLKNKQDFIQQTSNYEKMNLPNPK
jgi:hypothetical protein